MAQWGFGVWDANGKDVNKGFVPTLVLSYAGLSSGQLSGSWSFDLPQGTKLNFLFLLNGNEDGKGNRRSITVSGNTVNMTSAAENATGDSIFPPGAGWLIFWLE
ncbi:hypothetical protein [Pantoea agglomerans]|uniref:hypothetical protein n=1 Tax=Enterobacter agglomerans TaxID=549 RepID=UPI001786AA04|nr:hypothetical protein [Pantoea agglomerans]MBD8153313.1 hypothetical protein [Pantoea agglomerans]